MTPYEAQGYCTKESLEHLKESLAEIMFVSFKYQMNVIALYFAVIIFTLIVIVSYEASYTRREILKRLSVIEKNHLDASKNELV